MGDPPVVRGAIFELLRTGQLRAPSLHKCCVRRYSGPADAGRPVDFQSRLENAA